MSEFAVIDPHAPSGERRVGSPTVRSISPVLAALREHDDTDASPAERLKATIEGRTDEQAIEDAQHKDVPPGSAEECEEAWQQVEAAIDDAVDMSRVLEGRKRRSSLDTRRRRKILNILNGTEAA